MKLFIIFTLILYSTIAGYQCSISSAVPDILLNCYNATYRQPEPPLNTKLLIELIRKLENHKSQLSIRVLSNLILHLFKFDGIVRGGSNQNDAVIPFRAAGKQFYKYKFLVEHLTPGDSFLFPKGAINETDLCILHDLISNTIDLWERGDEKATCNRDKIPIHYTRQGTDTKSWSQCPLEKGVIRSRWGTISAGHLIASIASAMETDTVTAFQLVDQVRESNYSKASLIEGDIDNVRFAAVIGDLAEVVIKQGISNPLIGSVGYWNNTLLPRRHYLNGNLWDMSEAEMIGGIDGLILGSKIQEWVTKFELFRLSQLIDMYYSERGISISGNYRACTRGERFLESWNRTNVEKELAATVSVLQLFGKYDVQLKREDILTLARDVSKSYTASAISTISNYNACQQGGDNNRRQEIIVVMDETWLQYETEVFISYLSELVDVGFHGSKIGVINGGTGDWIAHVTSDLVQLFRELRQQKKWPFKLSLTKSLNTVISYYQNKQCSPFQTPYGRIVLVMAQSAYISDIDKKNAAASIDSIKNSNPEAKLIYVTSGENSQAYDELARHRNAMVLREYNSENIDMVVRAISDVLSEYAVNIVDYNCNRGHFEDYVTPELDTLYEIRGEYVAKENVTVTFKGNDYGDISVCGYDIKAATERTCKGIRGNEEAMFTARNICAAGESACTVHFTVIASNSSIKCSELDCRYPDQVRIDIFTTWSRANIINNTINLYLLFVFYLNI